MKVYGCQPLNMLDNIYILGRACNREKNNCFSDVENMFDNFFKMDIVLKYNYTNLDNNWK